MKDLSALRIPRGLADPRGEFAFVEGPRGLIYQLDLESGDVQARTNFHGSPLAIYAGALIGWTQAPGLPNVVRLFSAFPQNDLLSPTWEQDIRLPAWVDVGSSEPERFDLVAEIRDEQLVVTWEARTRYPGGAPPPPGIEAAETRDAGGAVYLDPETGRVLREEHRALRPGAPLPLPDLPANRRIVPYLQNGSWFTQPWSVNSEEAFLVASTQEPGISLVRREPGIPVRQVEIRLAEDPAAQAAVTPGGTFVFVHEPGSDPPAWLVYSVQTGQLIASLPFDSGTQGVSVVGDKVLYLVIHERGPTRRTSLRSRHLRTGQVMWSFTLGEEATRTPPPPPPGP